MEGEGGRLVAAFLASLFLIAGSTKIWSARARRGWREFARRAESGRMRGVALTILLPAAELLTAGMLVADARTGLIAAAALTAALGAGVLTVRTRLAGSRCSCFGPFSHDAVGVNLAIRNFLLAVVAVVAAGLSVSGATLRPDEVAVGAALAGAFLAGGAWSKARREIVVGRRLAGVSRAQAPGVIVVVSPGCPPCERLAPELSAFASEHPDAGLEVIIGPGPEHERARLARTIGSAARSDRPQLLERWHVPGTPWGIVLRADGRAAGQGRHQPLQTSVRSPVGSTNRG
jgi:thiol-disulfide isomerase/thioredoxin